MIWGGAWFVTWCAVTWCALRLRRHVIDRARLRAARRQLGRFGEPARALPGPPATPERPFLRLPPPSWQVPRPRPPRGRRG